MRTNLRAVLIQKSLCKSKIKCLLGKGHADELSALQYPVQIPTKD